MDQPNGESTLKKWGMFRILMVVVAVVVVGAAIAGAIVIFRNSSDSNSSTINQNTNAATTNQDFNTDAGTTVADTDHDGLSDSEERSHATDLSKSDTDDDGLSDFDEVNKYHTNPTNAHSGTLTVTDGQAVEQGIDPTTGDTLFATVPPTNTNSESN